MKSKTSNPEAEDIQIWNETNCQIWLEMCRLMEEMGVKPGIITSFKQAFKCHYTDQEFLDGLKQTTAADILLRK
jgi:hypothetical protein